MDKCISCNNSFKLQYEKFYKNIYDNFYKTFQHTKIDNHDVIKIIFSFLSHYNHIVIHQLKKKIPIPIDFNEDDDNDFDQDYYWNETKKICTFCFQNGIIESLNSKKRLPFLRRDINLFLDNEKNICDEILKLNEDKYNNFFYNYELPLYYNITYYRKELPVKINNKYVITFE